MNVGLVKGSSSVRLGFFRANKKDRPPLGFSPVFQRFDEYSYTYSQNVIVEDQSDIFIKISANLCGLLIWII